MHKEFQYNLGMGMIPQCALKYKLKDYRQFTIVQVQSEIRYIRVKDNVSRCVAI